MSALVCGQRLHFYVGWLDKLIRSNFPSKAIMGFPFIVRWSLTQRASSKVSATILRRIRAIVWRRGIPFSKARCFDNQENLLSPNVSISCHPSAPDIIALMTRNITSTKSCLRLVSERISLTMVRCSMSVFFRV